MTVEIVLFCSFVAFVTWIVTFFIQVKPACKRASEAGEALTKAKAQIDAWEDTEDRMKETFSSLASDALKENSQSYLALVSERYKQHSQDAKNNLDERKKAIENLISPISKSLSDFEGRVGDIKKEYGSVTKQISFMTDKTEDLVRALQRPEVRGTWGELQFRNVVEMAGMAKHVDFKEQSNIEDKEGNLRPDAIIRLPDNRLLVVDVKTPIDSYLKASKASNEDERKKHMKSYVDSFKKNIGKLSSKNYWEKLPDTPDFVVMYIPGEAFFSAALSTDPELIDYGVKQRVIISSPTTFISLLKTVAYCWQQHKFAKNMQEVAKLAEALFKSIKKFGDHMHKTRNLLEKIVRQFNDSVGSLERNVLPKARSFVGLGVVSSTEEIPEIVSIEEHPREISNPELAYTSQDDKVEE